ncbi:hypothetical protein BN3456_00313 [Clostridium sp. C105KSO13]|nr:hypothetical protein BN3456_00313 [Clostridium sp. C105KSO13]
MNKITYENADTKLDSGFNIIYSKRQRYRLY